ncbi:hypothetical protein ACJMK2_013303 [Sinanodonta woodiana]|uniref:Uncharacterized protein n=1 Tax=Sinanodonta woodiana TaxID=1069815 RepID=A0ABD3UYD1_SINWO
MNETSPVPQEPSTNYSLTFKKLTSPYVRALGMSVPVKRVTDFDKKEAGDDLYIEEGTTVMLTTPNSKSVKLAYTERNVPNSITVSIQSKAKHGYIRGKGNNKTRLIRVRNDIPETSVMSQQTGSTTESIIAVRGKSFYI